MKRFIVGAVLAVALVCGLSTAAQAQVGFSFGSYGPAYGGYGPGYGSGISLNVGPAVRYRPNYGYGYGVPVYGAGYGAYNPFNPYGGYRGLRPSGYGVGYSYVAPVVVFPNAGYGNHYHHGHSPRHR